MSNERKSDKFNVLSHDTFFHGVEKLVTKQMSYVKDFMVAGEQSTPKYLEFLNQPMENREDILKFRTSLVNEEILEFYDAVLKNNLTETLDALIDILYVSYGTLLSTGQKYSFVDTKSYRSIFEIDYRMGDFIGFSKFLDISQQDIKLESPKNINDTINCVFITLMQYYKSDYLNICEDLFDEVHSSNMSKVVDGKVIKNEFGKIMKPDTYFKPDLSKIIQNYDKPTIKLSEI